MGKEGRNSSEEGEVEKNSKGRVALAVFAPTVEPFNRAQNVQLNARTAARSTLISARAGWIQCGVRRL
jgi:hypothetical protein